MTRLHPTAQIFLALATAATLVACGHETALEPDSIGPTSDAGPAGDARDPDEIATAVEVCNGLDDDGDGVVDEGCTCAPGETQRCFPGGEDLGGVGICRAGTQHCTGGGEFASWGPCEGAVAPQKEECDDGIDQDCDGADAPCPAEERCETFTFGADARPVDIVWIIDQSSSMSGEIAMVRQHINDFVAFFSEQQLDYRVIVVASRSFLTLNSVCIPEPLAGPGCADGPRFRQVNTHVDSHDSLHKLMQQIDAVEAFMRPNSIRHVIEVSDDESHVSATDFQQFIAARPGYDDFRFHSIVGLTKQFIDLCVEAVGRQYIALSDATGGLKFHICDADWQLLFDALAENVTASAARFPLAGTPRPGTITVSFGSTAGVEGQHWSYDADKGELEIVERPPGATEVEVCYAEEA